ncbi:MAG: DUF3592 domain-containing protein [Pseudobdellovibrionaceae bacterium]
MRLKLFVLYGFVLWAFAGYVYFQENFVYSKWIPIQGEVTKLETYSSKEPDDDQQRPYYDFTVQYEFNGKENLVSKTKFSGVPQFKEGDSYLVRINPDNVEDVRVEAGSSEVLIWVALIGGGFLVFLGVLGFFVRR